MGSAKLLQLVDWVYAAACGEEPWQRTVAELCRVGNFDGCALSIIHPPARRRVVLASHGLTYRPEPDPMLGPTPSDMLATGGVLQSLGTLWQDLRIRSERLPTATLCWTDWTRRDGLGSWVCVIFTEQASEAGCLEAYADAGAGSRCPDLRGVLRQLAPHLSRAWRLGMTSRTILQHGEPPSATALEYACQKDAPPVPDALPEAARLRAEFGLTKAEARLALCLTRGWSLATAAEAFDVKLTTIRSQLQQVFSKTGTSRQAECVAMLLSRGYGSQKALGLPTEVTQTGAAIAE